MTEIRSFTGPNRVFSNFWPCRPGLIWLHFGLSGRYDHWFPTAEHGYQASKILGDAERDRVRLCATPAEAKQLGLRWPKTTSDWHIHQVMFHMQVQKYADVDLRKRLLDTDDALLFEGNTWHDNYWGGCTCRRCQHETKHNHLGKLIMALRWRLQNPRLFGEAV